MWLRVTPDEKAVLVEVDEAPFLGWFDYKADMGGWIADDPDGTIYYPITEDILKAAAAMANTIDGWDRYAKKNAYDAYRAAVEKAVKGV
jgi:hypothetical protein